MRMWDAHHTLKSVDDVCRLYMEDDEEKKKKEEKNNNI